MISWNTTVHSYSPVVTYSPGGAWQTVSSNDTNGFALYQHDNDDYMTTNTTNATAEFSFTGTGVWIFGKRGTNHGEYLVTLDGISNPSNRNTTPPFRSLLFGTNDLPFGEHIVQITNSPSDGSLVNLDIDYITWEQSAEDGDTLLSHYIDVSSAPNWQYPSAWLLEPSPNGTNGQVLTTSTANEIATLTFHGSHIEVYGSTSQLCGGYTISIDEGPPSELYRCFTATEHEQVLLYMADIQGQAAHTLKITNLEEDGRSELVINRAMVIYGVNSQDFDSDDPTSLASTENGSSDQRIVIIISLSIVLPAMLLLCLCTFLGTRNRRGGGFLWCNFWIPRVRPKSKHSIRLDKELDHLPAPLSGLYHLDKTSNSRPTLHLVLPTGVMMGGTTPSISPVPLTGATTASTDSAGDERLLERIRIKYGYMGKSPARAVGPGLLVPSIQETHQFPVPASPAIPWTVHVPQPPHRFQPYSRPPGRSRSMHTSVEAYDRREKRRRPQARLSLPPPPAYEQAVASSVSPVSEESLAMTIPQ